MKIRKILFLLIGITVLSSFSLAAQSGNGVDLNRKYKYPFSVTFDYRSYNPIPQFGTDFGGDYLINDFSLYGNLPLDFLPSLQPFAGIGLTTTGWIEDSALDEELAKYNNFQIYGKLGTSYRYMLSKQFEVGAMLGLGISEMVFNNDLWDDGNDYGQQMFMVDAGAILSLNLSYNMSFSFVPNLRFATNIGERISNFDGFIGGVSISGSVRFGEDPDSPQAEIRSIKAGNLDFPPIFAPMQSYYSKNPVTTISIQNIEKTRITDVTVSFFQAGFMDTPTKAATFDVLTAGEEVKVDIPAIYNQQVFTTEGITPLTGEIIVEYNNNERIASQKFPVSYDLYDKESLTWDDDNKVGAFITPADSALRNYSSYLRQVCKITL